MGLLNIFRPSRSIVSRLTWRITVATIISLILILGLIFFITYVIGATLLGITFGIAMEVTNEKMNTVFSNVETVVRNTVPEAKKNIYQDDMLFFNVQHMLKLNDDIMGTAIAFNPDYEPKKGKLHAPYAFRTSTGIHTTQLNSRVYNYPEKEWYKKPVELKKACWSEPYVDEGGGGFPMITYSLPLINDKDEVYAVYTADLSLDWIEALRQKSDCTFNENFMDVFDSEAKSHFTSFLVTRQGTIVAHPDSSLVMKASLKDYFKNIKAKEKRKEKIVQDILEMGPDTRFTKLLKDENERYIVMFAACVERTDWLMVVTLPVGDLLWLLNSMMIFMGFLSFIGIGIIVLACYFTVRKVTKPIRQFAASADEIAKGNFTAELPKVKTKDEMRRLRDSFETMQLSLVKQIEETKAGRTADRPQHPDVDAAENVPTISRPRRYRHLRTADACQRGGRRPVRLLPSRRETILLHWRRQRKRRSCVIAHGSHTLAVPHHLIPRITAGTHHDCHQRVHFRRQRIENVRHPVHWRPRPAYRPYALFECWTRCTNINWQPGGWFPALRPQSSRWYYHQLEIHPTGDRYRLANNYFPLYRRTDGSRKPAPRTVSGRTRPGYRL